MSFQNDPPSFASSSKTSPHSSVTLSHTIESIKAIILIYDFRIKLLHIND